MTRKQEIEIIKNMIANRKYFHLTADDEENISKNILLYIHRREKPLKDFIALSLIAHPEPLWLEYEMRHEKAKEDIR